jgi:hypothetical protein
MAKKQTRRSVSIRGSTYDRIRSYCENQNMSMSEFVEGRISSFFEGAVLPLPEPVVESPEKETESPPVSTVAPERPRSVSSQEEEEKLSFDEMQDAARIYTF